MCIVFRWVEEGELSFYEITHFFPDDVKLRGHDLITFGLSTKRPSYSGLSRTAKKLASYIHVTDVPAPDLLSLVKRYIEELQLPGLFYFYFYVGSTSKCIFSFSSMCVVLELPYFENIMRELLF
jgi:hypothetical protein